MNQIPTAEEYIKEYYPDDIKYSKEQVRRILTGFAKLHVEAAIEGIEERGVDKYGQQIENFKKVYPLINIK